MANMDYVGFKDAFQVMLPLVIILLLLGLLMLQSNPSSDSNKFPLVNRKSRYDFFYTDARKEFQNNAANLIRSGFQLSKRAFCMITDNGPLVVLSPKYAKEMRSDERISLGKFTAKEFHANIAGFEPLRVTAIEGEIIIDAIKRFIPTALEGLTKPLSAEAADAVSKNWTDKPDWHEIELKPSILNIVAQLSSRVFTGSDFCRNPDWHRITITYTIHVYQAAQSLSLWPKYLRPIVAQFLPACQKLRKQVQEAHKIMDPIVAQRRAAKASGDTPRTSESETTAIDWIEEASKGRSYDPATAQLLLSFAAIHSTADMITQALFDICGREKLIHDMREEIVSSIQENGWTRAALYNMKLMDSVLKESQRLKPTRMLSMGRVAEENITFSDGLEISKGTTFMVSSHSMWDEHEYPEANTFDGYRFLKLRRQAGQEKNHQLVSTSPTHMGFGYGVHACPGRFFAANEVKIALCHFLLKYDLKFSNGNRPTVISQGFNLFTDPAASICVKRRMEDTPIF